MDTSGPSELSDLRLIRQARLAEALAAAWMLVELVVALAAGIAARSVALTAFAVDSGIELLTALVVLRQLMLHTERSTAEELDRRERTSSRIVGWALYALIAYIVVSAAATLLLGIRPAESAVGIVLSAVAIPVMLVLWRWRLSLARRIGSPALRADAACSIVCAYMSATVLAGLALNAAFGWWWADTVAALALIWWIRGEAYEALEAARTGTRCGCGS
jgi:divalent metal cation (Fe/Co/Zn/Cd) transporter